MPVAKLIMDPTGLDPIVVIDHGMTGIHYLDLTEVKGISVGPGSSLQIYLSGAQVTINSVSAEDGERIVERWLSLRERNQS